jgi:ATP-dependent Clp protease adaptor protein ClpS
MMTNDATQEVITVTPTEVEQEAPPEGSLGSAYRVILYNDDWHGFEEVILQVHKATQYTLPICESITIEAHTRGRATCYKGTREKCQEVTRVLREIRLQCEVDCD